MVRKFTANVWHEDGLYVAQALEIDVASQGESEKEALDNLREALELYLEPLAREKDAANNNAGERRAGPMPPPARFQDGNEVAVYAA